MLCVMAAGTALVVLVGARRAQPIRAKPAPPGPPEAPWLTTAAEAQIVGPGGTLGPLFAGVELGGPAPPPEVRARIAGFARANHVDIDLEIVDEELAAVRFEATFGGCCGYEGADVLALRLGRPHIGGPCTGEPATWLDDWSFATEDGAYLRARIRVNRIALRWEPSATLPELVEHADRLLGTTVRKSDRWRELEPGRYLLEVAYPFDQLGNHVVSRLDLDDLGIDVRTERGAIVQVSLALARLDDDGLAALSARWGPPRTQGETTWTWRTPDRTITAELADSRPRITIRKRLP